MVTPPNVDLVILEIHTVKKLKLQSHTKGEGASPLSHETTRTVMTSVVFLLRMGNLIPDHPSCSKTGW